MPISTSKGSISESVKARAKAEGFDDVRITTASLLAITSDRLREFVDLERHGDMAWMAETIDRRAKPQAMWPEARSAIMLSLSYGPDGNPLDALSEKSNGVISVYAQNRDYHDLIKGKLKRIAQWFATTYAFEVKVFVDTAPLMEKPLAAQAGLGWQGKHTNLVSRELGSWFFLGAILTTAELEIDAPEIDHCGSCRACLDVCPTNAFPAPYQLDARRCISYLTIENKTHIPQEFREAMGNRIYGCDDCLAACPWNKFASEAREAKLVARDDLKSPPLSFLLALDDKAFREFFSGSPIKRIGRDRFIRNCLIAAGNSSDLKLVDQVITLLDDPSEFVRAAAIWALKKLDDPQANKIQSRYIAEEKVEAVKAEWLLR